MDCGSPVQGHEVDILTYANQAELIQSTITAINRCMGDGYRKPHIALISCRGRETSALSPYDRLGPYTLKRPTGTYDLLGNPTFSEGEIVVDSVHRFKGRASPCVVLTEVDFEHYDENAQRRLFVGATRATMKLVLVVSERTARDLLNNQG